MAPNRLYYGDNLDILSAQTGGEITPIADESVDTIYLDPPFNSKRSYSVLFKEQSGVGSTAQIKAFEDSWKWGDEAERTLLSLHEFAPARVVDLVNNLVVSLKHNDVSAYIVMLAPRLCQMHRTLKQTGTLWFHCDATASHYVKLLLDAVFGATNYVNEVIWKRTSAHSDVKQGAKHCGHIHDVIFIYAKHAGNHYWNVVYQEYDQDYVDAFYVYVEYPDGTLCRIKDAKSGLLKVVGEKRTVADPDFEKNGRRLQLGDLTAAKSGGQTDKPWRGIKPYRGRYWAYSFENLEKYDQDGLIYFPKDGGAPRFKRYLDKMPGVPLQDLWTDIKPTPPSEQQGFKTQKPLGLLRRIIKAACPPDGVILDPFCGCGTTVCAAQELGRHWIGIDITYLSILVISRRLQDLYGTSVSYIEEGAPRDFAGAEALAERDKYQFQYWVCKLVGAQPLKDDGGKPKKGKDEGVDGVMYLHTSMDRKPMKAILQVKGGKKGKLDDVKAFVTTLKQQGATFGCFVSLFPPTEGMKKAAALEGIAEEADIPRLQLRCVQDLLEDKHFAMPTVAVKQTSKRAVKSKKDKVKPGWMFSGEVEED